MNKEINLSYVLTTRNKLPYLKEVMKGLLDYLQSDEEIIVIDCKSNDGTVEFLTALFSEGKIHQFITEPDKGESHGYSKGLLMARGKLIKPITDDDAYNFNAIQQCKEFMLLHTEIDVMGGNTASLDIGNKDSLYWDENFYLDFIKWREGSLKRFFFNGTCLMLRRSSLPLIGLPDTNVLLADMEYTLRLSGIVNLAWCTSLVSVRILNSKSNNLVYQKRADEESRRLCNYYDYKYPWERSKVEQQQESLKKYIRTFTYKVLKRNHKAELTEPAKIEPFASFEQANDYCLAWLQEHPLNQIVEFIKRDN